MALTPFPRVAQRHILGVVKDPTQVGHPMAWEIPYSKEEPDSLVCTTSEVKSGRPLEARGRRASV